MDNLKLAYPDVPELWVEWLVEWATEHPEEYNKWLTGKLELEPKARDTPGEIKTLRIIKK